MQCNGVGRQASVCPGYLGHPTKTSSHTFATSDVVMFVSNHIVSATPR